MVHKDRWFLYADLDNTESNMPVQYADLSKNSTVPSVHGGVLWPDTINKYLYLYGGEYEDSAPDSFVLWAYDIVNDRWEEVLRNPRDNVGVQRVSYGAGVAVQELGIAYYYGGWLSSDSVPRLATSNLITYDMIENSWKNQTATDSVPRAEGVMLHLPVSARGVLVYLGGIETSGNIEVGVSNEPHTSPTWFNDE